MKFSSMILPAAALSMLFAACQDEDFGFTTKDVKSAKYDQEFIKAFGEVDPNQDWSMAAETRALVNLPNIQGTAKMNIMTGDPHNASTRLLGQVWLQNGQAELTFDAIEGKNNVFVTVEQDGKYKLYGQYNIVNGMLCIGNVEMPLTRATGTAFSETCPTTFRTTGNYLVEAEYATYPVFDHEAIKYNNEIKTINEWIADVKANVNEQTGTTYKPFTDESVRHFVVVTGIDWENSTLELKSGAVVNTADLYVIGTNFRTLDECKTLAESRGENLKNNNGDFPFTLESVMVFETVSDEWNTWQKFNGFDWSNPVLKDGAYMIPAGEAITYNSQTKKIVDWQAEANTNAYLAAINAQQYDGPWVNSSFTFFESDVVAGTTNAIYKGLFPEEHWERKADAVDVDVTKDEHVKIQYLDNVETIPADPWNVSLGNSLFGVNAFFEERVAYDDPKKVGKYYSEAELAVMEEGYMVHTTGEGTIDMPFIFGCTDYSDQFGYVYWKDGEENDPNFDIRKLKHFILIEDGRPGSNITCDNGTVDGKTFSSGKWESLSWTNNNYTGTTYRVMFFGENRDQTTGSYTFPAGYNIVFFISCLAQSDQPGLLFTDHNPHGFNASFNYSVTKYNQLLGHLYDGSNPDKQGSGQVKCLAWSRDGNTYMGFGDNCGDRDLNDMVFLLQGNFDKPRTVVAPVKWHKNYDGQHHNGENGTSLDDDLFTQYSLKVGQSYIQPQQNGSNWEPTHPQGYTFLGWSTEPSATTGSKTISGNAVEAGTCYFAIWDTPLTPGDDPEWQSWIFACEDLGGSYDYDFNDLVFAVQKTAITGTDNVKLELIPLAAGGTLNAEVWYGDTKVEEIHKLLGSDDYKTQNLGGTAGTAVTLAESVPASTTVSSIARSIKIQVTQGEGDVKNGSYTLSHTDHNKEYKTPEILILPGGWDWPNEGVLITNVYPGFASWSGDINATDWVNTKKEGTVAGEHYIVNPLKGGESEDTPVTPTTSSIDVKSHLSGQTLDLSFIEFNQVTYAELYVETSNGCSIGISDTSWGNATWNIASGSYTEILAFVQTVGAVFNINLMDNNASITKVELRYRAKSDYIPVVPGGDSTEGA